ncbi:DMT family transporter [Acidimangrovimonas sediminis]|uniref:DMT family transporter n=1 Tax=Acidimangrovimonas sediminis TaxID=2056283 RepID=UPI000C8089AB|nr:DMT family transporter [Acidimangrovimonas sediminis]
MRLFLLATLTMIAFAANSVLTRLALALAGHGPGMGQGPDIGPAEFAVLRLASGAVMLGVLVHLRRAPLGLAAPGRIAGVLSLAVYVLGFSFAYLTLPAGLGALILFGMVQITMFAGAALGRETMPPRRWAGAALAFAGLVWLLWPTGVGAPPAAGALMMAAAGAGWGIYSLKGRGARDPQAATAANFLLATPIAFVALPFVPGPLHVSAEGAVLAILSGAVTSGLGYALWYAVLPRLAASSAAVAQLTVPLIAMAGGALFLAEPLTHRFAVSAALVIAGVLISLSRPRARARRA